MQAEGQQQQPQHQPSSASAKDEAAALAAKETKGINILRFVTLVLLLSIATLASVGVYFYTQNSEKQKFEDDYTTNARLIIDSFHDSVEHKLGAVNVMADSITSHALTSEEEFPGVTLPNFAVHGSNLRVQSDSLVVSWLPLVTDDNRLEWEEYALANRNQTDEEYEKDMELRNRQDEEFGFLSTNVTGNLRPPSPADTVLDDGTGFHPKIFSFGIGPGTTRGDEPEGSGPFLPLWQRSPMHPNAQQILNYNIANAPSLTGVLPRLLETKEAIMNRVVFPPPGPSVASEYVKLSQSREQSWEYHYVNGPHTFFAYPVFDSFGEDRQVAGVLSANTHWRQSFTNILPNNANGYLCILENSYNQTLSYQIDGPDVIYLGKSDPHDERYDHLEQFADINEYLQDRAGISTRSYTTVPLNQQFGKYRLRIYPSASTEELYVTNKPWLYTAAVFLMFLVTTIVLIVLDRFVARRQQIVMDRVVKAAEETAAFEHDLNAFLAHEVRKYVVIPIAATQISVISCGVHSLHLLFLSLMCFLLCTVPLQLPCQLIALWHQLFKISRTR